MRQSIVFVLALLPGCDSSKQSDPPGSPLEAVPALDPDAPHLSIDAAEHDFGCVYQGETVSHNYRIRNEGERPLHIELIRSTCGCGKVEISTPLIPFGTEASLLVEFQSSNFPGRQLKTISLLTNDPTKPKFDVRFRADVIPLYEISPSLLDFGEAYRSEQTSQSTQIRLLHGQSVRILRWLDPRPDLSVEWSALPESESCAFDVHVTLGPDAPIGPFAQLLTLETDHARLLQVKIPVRAVILPDVEYEPRLRLDFGKISRKTAPNKAVRVRNRRSDLPLSILSVSVEPDDSPLRVMPTEVIEPGVEYRIVVEANPDYSGKYFLSKLKVLTDQPDEPCHIITVQGIFLDP